ncbi:hypothetical protein MAJ_06775, partial [Metarhizium majus ARSEF 297]
MNIDTDGICGRCYQKDAKRRPDKPYFFSSDNQLDFGPVPERWPQLTPTEESLIARVHVHVNIMLVRGQHRQFTRQPVTIWLNHLRLHHPGYRCIIIDEERLNQLPEDGNVLDAIPQSQVEAADAGSEVDQEAEPDVEDEAAVPNLFTKDTSSMLCDLFSPENQKLIQGSPPSRHRRGTSCSFRIHGARQLMSSIALYSAWRSPASFPKGEPILLSLDYAPLTTRITPSMPCAGMTGALLVTRPSASSHSIL